MSEQTGGVLAAIDATLEGWHGWDLDVSTDAMRWAPEEPQEHWTETADGDLFPPDHPGAMPAAGVSPLEAYRRHLDLQLAQMVRPGTTFAAPDLSELASYVRVVLTPAMTQIGRALSEAFRHQAAMAERVLAQMKPLGIVQAELPADPRERALLARRSRGTGPAPPGLDGRRRRIS